MKFDSFETVANHIKNTNKSIYAIDSFDYYAIIKNQLENQGSNHDCLLFIIAPKVKHKMWVELVNNINKTTSNSVVILDIKTPRQCYNEFQKQAYQKYFERFDLTNKRQVITVIDEFKSLPKATTQTFRALKVFEKYSDMIFALSVRDYKPKMDIIMKVMLLNRDVNSSTRFYKHFLNEFYYERISELKETQSYQDVKSYQDAFNKRWHNMIDENYNLQEEYFNQVSQKRIRELETYIDEHILINDNERK